MKLFGGTFMPNDCNESCRLHFRWKRIITVKLQSRVNREKNLYYKGFCIRAFKNPVPEKQV